MKVLITAGPTREPIDPVRFLSNRSSGKMGYALAAAFAHEGHAVRLISGPTRLDVPPRVDFIPVTTAAEMHRAVVESLAGMDIAVFAAAVADYTPAKVATAKIKKTAGDWSLMLTPTVDILGSARDVPGFHGTLIGFAAETENLERNAREKLVRKRCDLIVANDVSQSGIGFDADDNRVILVYPEHSEPLPTMSKTYLAGHLVEEIFRLRFERVCAATPEAG